LTIPNPSTKIWRTDRTLELSSPRTKERRSNHTLTGRCPDPTASTGDEDVLVEQTMSGEDGGGHGVCVGGFVLGSMCCGSTRWEYRL